MMTGRAQSCYCSCLRCHAGWHCQLRDKGCHMPAAGRILAATTRMEIPA